LSDWFVQLLCSDTLGLSSSSASAVRHTFLAFTFSC